MYNIHVYYIYYIYIYIRIYIYMIFWLKDSSEAKGIQLLLVLCCFFFLWMKLLWASGCFVLENQIVQDFPSFVLPQAGRRIPKDSISIQLKWGSIMSTALFWRMWDSYWASCEKNQREHRKTITWMWISLHIRFIDIHNHFGAHKWNLYEVYGL